MSRSAGFTLVEVLIVLALLAVLGSGLAWTLRPSLAVRSAEAYRAAVHGARIDAMAGTPTSVRFAFEEHRFVVRRGPEPCSGRVTGTLAPEPRVAVVRTLRDGIVWHPDGTGRACGGGGVYGGRVRFEGPDGDVADVVVASTGRLRIERSEAGTP